jgi:hypothetical protein
VRLQIAAQVKGVAGLAAIRGGTLQPIETMRQASTIVTMGDGETLVIGGLYTNSCVTEKAKTPLLSEIPLLGHLFTRTRETQAKTELVFLLTPRIVRKTGDLRIITPPAELERLEAEPEDGKPCPRPFVPTNPHDGPPPVRSTPISPWRPGPIPVYVPPPAPASAAPPPCAPPVGAGGDVPVPVVPVEPTAASRPVPAPAPAPAPPPRRKPGEPLPPPVVRIPSK